MKQGYLKEYFDAAAVKQLRAVEIVPTSSSQHELNGTSALKEVLGRDERRKFPTRFIWIDDEGDVLTDEGSVTWYDSRANHPKRSEHRLYYPTSSVSELANVGDSLFIARRSDDSLMMIITPPDSTADRQLRWLFDLTNKQDEVFVSHEVGEQAELDFAVRMILEALGIDIEEPEAERLDRLLQRFDGAMPTTREFSAFARETLPEVSARDDPDGALTAWMDHEEKLFRRMEHQRISRRLFAGFGSGEDIDVEDFISFSLSIQNSRKSRAGHAFENHIATILAAHELLFDHGKCTENRSKPDFLFPGIREYQDLSFASDRLTMLGAKTTCKDRWRQVLAEAKRIPSKHLITVEPSISERQTDEMRAHDLQLIVPTSIARTFRPSQQEWLMNVSDFISHVRDQQSDR